MKTSRQFISVIHLSLVVAAVTAAVSVALALPMARVAVAEDPCVTPGISILTDPALDTGLTLGTVPGAPQQDIREVLIAEPGQPGGVRRLAVTIKVEGDLSTLPENGIWRAFFKPSTGTLTYFVGVFNDALLGLQFNYGTAGTTTTTLGAADGGSMSLADKSFTILIDNSKVGNPAAGTALTGIYGRTQTLGGAAGNGATPTHDLAPDTAPASGTGTYTMVSTPCPTPTPTPTPTPSPTPGSAGLPRFHNYYAPLGMGENAGEPSIGVNWTSEQSFSNSMFTIPNGGTTMYFGGFMTAALRVTFSDCSSPADALWEQKALLGPNAPRVFGDPILFTDKETGRTLVAQLLGLTPAGSTTDITDDDGETFIPSQGSNLPSDIDHQTYGGGRFHAPLTRDPNGPVYPNAVYYASQSVGEARAALSLDGGITYGPGTLMYTVTQCAGLHGHIKVAPDGTVYIPNKACGPATSAPFHDTESDRQTLVFSEDNGITWILSPIPDSTTNADRDPSIGIATDGTIYFGYQARDGHARIAVGKKTAPGVVTWSPSYDVGEQLGIENMAFAEVAAGDPDRASFAFFGTTEPGAYDVASFPGIWYLYVASTFDGGQTWSTQNITPGDPIQRGGICGSGTCRNLLDFFDATIDKEGRFMIAGQDGCIGSCVDAPPNSFSAKAFITRQTGGKRMFAQYDPGEPGLPGAPLVSGYRSPETTAHLSWEIPDGGGGVITGYKVYRSVGGGAFALLVSVQEPNYTDLYSGPTASYRLTAVSAAGEGPYCSDFDPAAGTPPIACVAPGILVINDLLTDGTDNDFGANIPPDPRVNIRQLHIAEPFLGTGVNKLVFRMQVAPSTLAGAPPSSQWFIIWNKLNPNSNFNREWVGMRTDAAGAMRFEYGDFGVALDPLNPNPNGNKAVKVGDADSGSYDPATGLITITVSNSKLENVQAPQTIAGMIARTFLAKQESESKAVQSAADTTDPSHYDLSGSAACQLPVQLGGVASRKVHTGLGPFDIALPPTGNAGVECRTGGANGDYQLVFTFANPLTSVGGASVTAGTGSITSSSIQNGREYVVNLTGVGNAQRLTVTLTNVSDTTGNSSASIPATMGVLIGDTTGNGSVNSSDISQTKSQSGQNVTASNFRQDVTINGSINSSDISLVKSRSGTALPTLP